MAENYNKNSIGVEVINQYFKSIGSDVVITEKEINSLFDDIVASGKTEVDTSVFLDVFLEEYGINQEQSQIDKKHARDERRTNKDFDNYDPEKTLKEFELALNTIAGIDSNDKTISLEELFASEEEYELEQQKQQYKTDDWESVESFSRFIDENTTQHIFSTNDNSQIIVKDTDGVEIYQNKETGEIAVFGLKDAEITGNKLDSKINIFDSSLNYIDMGSGNDDINLYNSTVEKIQSGSGDDNIFINNSFVSSILAGDGDDFISILNSNAENLSIRTENGNDKIVVKNSNIDKINSGNGDDTINIANSTVNSLNTEKGKNSVELTNANIKDLKNQKDDILIENKTVSYENMNTESQDIAKNVTNSKTSAYGKNLTPEEQVQAIAIDNLETNLNSMIEQF